jgi:hypothetical protein
MRNRPYLFLGGLLVAVLGWAAWQALRPRQAEPVYEGHPLSYWLAPSQPQLKLGPSGFRGVAASRDGFNWQAGNSSPHPRPKRGGIRGCQSF